MQILMVSVINGMITNISFFITSKSFQVFSKFYDFFCFLINDSIKPKKLFSFKVKDNLIFMNNS